MPTNNSWNSQNPAQVAKGGTGVATFNTDGVVISNTTSTGALNALSLTNGQIVIGSSSGAPTASTISAGSGISVTNGANSITITASGSSAFTWVGATSLTNMLPNHGYLCDCSAGSFGLILPSSPSIGDRYIVTIVKTSGANTVFINNNSSQFIQYGNVSSTVTTGYIELTELGDSIEIVYAATNQFQVLSSVGNLTVY